ncbi:MAG: CcmD family protein [Deltaproteobacteria bacterium]
MSPLAYVGAAYAVVWTLIFFYAWRLTSSSAKLEHRIEQLERDAAGHD